MTSVTGITSARREPVVQVPGSKRRRNTGMPAGAAKGDPQRADNSLSGPAMNFQTTSGVKMQEAGARSTGASQVSQGMVVEVYSLSLGTRGPWPPRG